MRRSLKGRFMKKSILKTFIIIAAVFILCCIAVVITKKGGQHRDIVRYEGKTYELLEYNMDIFTYFYNSNEYLEVDEVHPVSSESFDAVYFDGDIFIDEKQVGKAKKYYADDKNYSWFVAFDKNDSVVKMPLHITSDELEYLYNMENAQKREAFTFDDIEMFSSIVKESRDGFIFALTTLARCSDKWYWKTEIMNDNNEEYMVPLPETLNRKLSELSQPQ